MKMWKVNDNDNNEDEDGQLTYKGLSTRGPQALTVTWVSETLLWLLIKMAYICISTAHHRINENQRWYIIKQHHNPLTQ